MSLYSGLVVTEGMNTFVVYNKMGHSLQYLRNSNEKLPNEGIKLFCK